MNDRTKDNIGLEISDLLYPCLLVAMILVFSVDFFPSNLNPDSARYMLSALVQSEAAIFAIVVTLSLVAIQLSAASYSPRVIGLFQKTRYFWMLVLIYILSMVLGLYALIQIIETGRDTIVVDFWSPISLSYRIGIIAFVSLIPYIWNTIELLKPSTIIDKLAQNITLLNIRDSSKSSQPVFAVMVSSLDKKDYEAVISGFKAIERVAEKILVNDRLASDDEIYIIKNLIDPLLNFGSMPADNRDLEVIAQLYIVTGHIGATAAKNKHLKIAKKALDYLNTATETAPNEEAIAIIRAIGLIGLTAIDQQEVGPEDINIPIDAINILQHCIWKAIQRNDTDISLSSETFACLREIALTGAKKGNKGVAYSAAVSLGSYGNITAGISQFICVAENAAAYLKEIEESIPKQWLHERLYCLMNAAEIFLKLHKYENAIDIYNKVSKLKPSIGVILDTPTALAKKGFALLKLSRYDEAVECCDMAIDIDHKHYFANVYKGYIFYKMQQFEKAIICFRKAIEIGRLNSGDYKSPWCCLISALEALHLEDEAAQVRAQADAAQIRC